MIVFEWDWVSSEEIMEVEEGVNSFWDLHSFSNDTKAEFNTVFINIVLLFIQNNS